MALTAKRNNPGAFANKEAVFLKDSLFLLSVIKISFL